MKERLFQFDNTKAVLIFLVVFGHLIEPLNSLPVYKQIYSFIYSFHMPCFVFLSGYFSKPVKISHSFNKLIAPLIVFNLFYLLLHYLLDIQNTHSIFRVFIVPTKALWYLLSLFFWTVSLNVIKEKNILTWFVASVFLSLLSGFVERPHLLSIGRTLVFFPYFLFGYYVKVKGLSLKTTNLQRLLFISFFALSFYASSLIFSRFNFAVMFGSVSFNDLHLTPIVGILIKLYLMVVSFLSIIGLSKIIPQNKTLLSDFGTRTLQVYLFHITFLLILISSGFYVNPGYSVLSFAAISILVCYVTSYRILGSFISGIVRVSSSLYQLFFQTVPL